MGEREAYAQLGKFLNERLSDQLLTQLSVFQSALINFASEHGEEIANSHEFRGKFTQMCLLAGVDPLELLIYTSKEAKGSNFLTGLTVRIVEVCQQTRDLNGGLISMKELLSRLQDTVSLRTTIDENDVQQALTNLNSLGKGYEVIGEGKKWLKFASASGDNISNDQRKVYDLCGFMGGYVTYRLLKDNYGWDRMRCKSVIDEMIMNGFLWVDAPGKNREYQYWEPSWISS